MKDIDLFHLYLNYHDKNTIHVFIHNCFICGIIVIKNLKCKLPLKQGLNKHITSDYLVVYLMFNYGRDTSITSFFAPLLL